MYWELSRIRGLSPLLFALCLAAQAAASEGKRLPSAPLDARCVGQPGYADFREKLRMIVERRDGPAFQALFAPGGAMRVHGFGGRNSAADWGWDRFDTSRVWQELDAILKLGCSVDGQRLYLPAMAVLVRNPEIGPGYVAALADLDASPKPGGHGPGLQRVKKGQLLPVMMHDTPAGWTEVRLNGRKAYVREPLVRSPHGFLLALTHDGTSWRIREFTDGV